MSDSKLKRTINAEAETAETTSAEKETFKRIIISDTDDMTENAEIISENMNNVIHKNSRIKQFFSENLMLCLASMISAAAVIAAFFFIGSIQPKKQENVDSKYAALKENSSKYNSLLSDTDKLGTEIDDLTIERDRMKGETDALKDYESKSPEIDSQIESLQTEIDAYNADNSAKQAEINSLTGSISTKTASIVNLPSGIYTVGENITAGTYIVTGSGKILISNSQGGVKVNTILTADGTSVTLDDGDKLQLDTRAKFTPSSSATAQSEQTGGN